LQHLDSSKAIYCTDRSAGADQTHNLGIRLFTPSPSHALFSCHMFREKMREFNSNRDYTILHAPTLEVDPEMFGTRSGSVIATCFDTRTIIVLGTEYAGEIKKSIFSVLNYILPEFGVLPMHAGANKGAHDNDTSVFFGLSGTGKTTLSTDDGKLLIGDDEHGLTDHGIFNFEGGCYAKTHKLSKANEPGIWKATNRFGALVENVRLDDKTREIDFYDDSITENGRSSYPLSFIGEIEGTGCGKVPNNIFFLTADAFGVLPPVSKLTKSQAMFYFVLGYTAKVAGTEVGIKEPTSTFSPCFGAPFMMRHPEVYAKLLGEYLDKHPIDVWLVNTGWSKGPYGVGDRFPIAVTREIIRTVQAGKLATVPTEKDPIFGLNIPTKVASIAQDVLFPQKSWKDGQAYVSKATELAKSFHKQMAKFGNFYESHKNAGPMVK